MKTKKKIVKLLKIAFLAVGSSLILFGLFQFWRGDFFNVSQVSCFDNHHPCQADLWFRFNGLVLGENIVFLSPQEIEEKIKEELIEIDEVKIEKRLPNKLIFHLSKRKPIAVIEANSEYYQVDYQGIILAKINQPTDLPLVVSDEIIVTADSKRIESVPILTSLSLLYQLLFSGLEVRRAEISQSRKLTLHLKTGPEVLLSLDRDLKKQVDSLQLILERAKIEGKQIMLIDLRFDKPVIKYPD